MGANRLAIVGLGYMGLQHLRILTQMKESALFDNLGVAVVCDTDEAHSKDVSSRFSVPNLTTDAAEAIQSDSVDEVIIATPPKYHYQQAKLAVEAGKPVYCEKPLGLTIDESRELADLVAQTGTPNQVGTLLRHSPALQYIKRVLDSGKLGKILHFTYSSNSCFPGKGLYRTDSKTKRQESGGGILHEENIHDIDAMIYLFGDFFPSDVVLGKFDNSLDIETKAAAKLHFADGVNGEYASEWHHIKRKGQRLLEITCEKGAIRADYFVNGEVDVQVGTEVESLSHRQLLTRYAEDHSLTFNYKPLKQWYASFAVYSFLKHVQDGGKCTPGFADSARAEERIQQMYDMATWSKG